MSRVRRTFTKEFKLTIVREYESGTSVPELIRKYDIHANLVYKWSQEYRLNPSGAFRSAVDSQTVASDDHRVAELERLLGRLTLENDFLKKALKHAETHMEVPKVASGAK